MNALPTFEERCEAFRIANGRHLSRVAPHYRPRPRGQQSDE